jgi:hypothetical protein
MEKDSESTPLKVVVDKIKQLEQTACAQEHQIIAKPCDKRSQTI